ncbi:hypothetical protein BJX99DRAFT_263194 [Aspergillus californicus]
MGQLKQPFRIPFASAMPPSSAFIQDDFASLPMTPPEPADGLLTPPRHAPSVGTAIHVISTERAALAHLERLYQTDQLAQDELSRAVDQIARTVRNGGKLVCCGVGKSGKIAQKLEATMNSLGIYSTFLHPTEALHGDLGMIRPNDTLLLISFSGRTPELLLLLPHIPASVTVIALTSHLHPSTCPLLSFQPSGMSILLPAPVHEDEETSIGVCAPTSSTTVALSLGDALAIATARRLHTSPGKGPAEVFKSYHPGGSIGAASTVSTPMSMSAVSFTSTPPEFLLRQPIHPSFPEAEENQAQEARREYIVPPDSIANLISTPLHQIPIISSSNRKIRLLDVLLTAIQHPNAKSWVFISQSVAMPPRQLRYLSQSDVDMEISFTGDFMPPYLSPKDSWSYFSDECTIDEVRRSVSSDSNPVIAVVRGNNLNDILGVLEVEDLWDNSTT